MVMDKLVDLRTARLLAEILKDQYKNKEIKCYEHEGVLFSEANVNKAMLDEMPGWKARTDDVFIVTYPKAGTTWTQEIMYLAMNGGNIERAQESHTMFRVPYLESNMTAPKVEWSANPRRTLILLWCLLKIFIQMLLQGQLASVTALTPCAITNMMKSPRFIKSHLPQSLLPPDIFHKRVKIVYVARNPKDVAVSFYHFHRMQPKLPTFEWDEFFERFMSGKVLYGHWYEHILGFWKMRNDENILFLKYEDMKRDEKAAVKQICEFLGYDHSDEIIERITDFTTFTSMKQNPMTNPDSFSVYKDEASDLSFMRKGEIGDWKNYFTDAQNEAFDAQYQDKLAGTGLDFDFE